MPLSILGKIGFYLVGIRLRGIFQVSEVCMPYDLINQVDKKKHFVLVMSIRRMEGLSSNAFFFSKFGFWTYPLITLSPWLL